MKWVKTEKERHREEEEEELKQNNKIVTEVGSQRRSPARQNYKPNKIPHEFTALVGAMVANHRRQLAP